MFWSYQDSGEWTKKKMKKIPKILFDYVLKK